MDNLTLKRNAKIGQWTLLRESEKAKWVCRCSCGAEHTIAILNLLKGRSSSCVRCKASKPNPIAVGTRIAGWEVERQVGEGYSTRTRVWSIICPTCQKATRKSEETLRNRSTHACEACGYVGNKN